MEKDRKKPPVLKKGELPTLTLGYLNSAYCPSCGEHLFSYYDKDLTWFCLSEESNYCRNCGQHLDLDRYKNPEREGKIMHKPQMMI